MLSIVPAREPRQFHRIPFNSWVIFCSLFNFDVSGIFTGLKSQMMACMSLQPVWTAQKENKLSPQFTLLNPLHSSATGCWNTVSRLLSRHVKDATKTLDCWQGDEAGCCCFFFFNTRLIIQFDRTLQGCKKTGGLGQCCFDTPVASYSVSQNKSTL